MNEHLTAIFVSAMYHYLTGNEEAAEKDMFLLNITLGLLGRPKVMVA